METSLRMVATFSHHAEVWTNINTILEKAEMADLSQNAPLSMIFAPFLA
jgi:hypothetical protein